MPQFRKKPVVIEAIQLSVGPSNGNTNDAHEERVWAFIGWAKKHQFDNWTTPDEGIDIQTLEGVMHASPGDWIIKGVQGEFYPCKPDIFEATYDAVDA